MLPFREYLCRRYRFADEYIAFYCRWVQLFRTHHEKTHISEDDAGAIATFLARQSVETSEWQMRQAHKALFLYFGYRACRGVIPDDAGIPGPGVPTTRADTLLRLTNAIRLRHLAHRTEDAYRSWAARFLSFTGTARPSQIGEKHLKAFLTHLAVDRKVSAATQRQAFNALLFLFRYVLAVPVLDLASVVRAKIGKPLPVVLTIAEVRAIIVNLHGIQRLMAVILYGAGIRLSECLSLRV